MWQQLKSVAMPSSHIQILECLLGSQSDLIPVSICFMNAINHCVTLN